MSETAEGTKKANKSAGPVTLGLGGLLLGGAVTAIGAASAAPAVVILGALAILGGAGALLVGVYSLVENLDAATQSLLDRDR